MLRVSWVLMVNILKTCSSMVMFIVMTVSLVPARKVIVTSCLMILGGIFLSST